MNLTRNVGERLMCTSSFSFNRLAVAILIVFIFMVTVNAYTVVLYGGKRIEIPAKFTVSSTALSYEVSPGIRITLGLATIDVSATERANNEPGGSFLRRMSKADGGDGTSKTRPLTQSSSNIRTVTNRDLVPYERARLESEKAYEQRRRELSLPSLEESRRRAERVEAALDEIIARRRQEESENYWRERQAELQAAMAAARMNALDSPYAEPYWPGGFIAVDNGAFGPFDSRFRFGVHRRFPFGSNQESPCGFNPSAACLLSQPFPFGVNQPFFPRRRTIFVAPGANVGGRRFGGGVFVNPGRRR
jgi:hypothetical protein